MDQLTAYESHTDPLYYTMRFIDGLKSEFKSVILVQRPPDWDTACALALLQEEVLEQEKQKAYHGTGSFQTLKPVSRNAMPIPLPPQPEKPPPASFSDIAKSRSGDDKMAALRAFRRAKGLCVKCAEKWSRNHTCLAQVQLRAIQEVWEALQLDEMAEQESLKSEPQEQLFMAVSVAALSGSEGPRTMRFQGEIQGKSISILVNLGSSHTFIGEDLAACLGGVSQIPRVVVVQVADGATLQCKLQLLQANWSVQGCVFESDMKVLALKHYDMIVGMDWLEKYSPMKVHWKQKWMVIPYEGHN